MLLEKGADPRAQDNRGERPGDKFDSEVRAPVCHANAFPRNLVWAMFNNQVTGVQRRPINKSVVSGGSR